MRSSAAVEAPKRPTLSTYAVPILPRLAALLLTLGRGSSRRLTQSEVGGSQSTPCRRTSSWTWDPSGPSSHCETVASSASRALRLST